ncbi:hypothetical protein NIES4071_42490 [Calothrix sp. NIES-4071]|nr:hypothetical protein NIES4071_42490 [Calothrix sp. NIES-4071]BAZ58562.1 hypothetical protein NIES4105_42410 [Calothrix sp. NIES-4105]
MVVGRMEESAIRESVNAREEQPNRQLRQAAQSLRSEGLQDLYKRKLEASEDEQEKFETPQQQRQKRQQAGTLDEPIIIPNQEGHFAAQIDVASAERLPWTNEYFAFGEYSSDDKPVREVQTGSKLPGSIFVTQGGKYQELMSELRQLEEDTGFTPTDVVQAMEMLIQTGRVPKAFAKYPQYKEKVKAITRLMFDVEPGRGLPATVTIPINFDLMKQGAITPEEAFVTLNLMSPKKIAKVAHEADLYLGFVRVGEYQQKATNQQVQQFLSNEREWLVRYLLSKSQGDNPLLKTEADLQRALDSLPDILVTDAKKFFTPK